MLYLRPKTVLDQDDTMWVFAGSAGMMSERILAPNHYYFRPVRRVIWGFATTGPKQLRNIDDFHIPPRKAEKEGDNG